MNIKPVTVVSIMQPDYWGASVTLPDSVEAALDVLKNTKNLAASYLLAEHPHGLDEFDTALQEFAKKNAGKRVKWIIALSSVEEPGEIRCSVCQCWLEPGSPVYGNNKDHLICWHCHERTPSDLTVR